MAKKTIKYSRLVADAKKILNKYKSGKTVTTSEIDSYKKVLNRYHNYSAENFYIQENEISDKKRLKALKKNAIKQKRTASIVPFALRRNKRELFGDMTASKYIKIMQTLKCYAKGYLKNSKRLKNIASKKAKNLKIDTEETYYGKNNLIKIGESFCPVITSRYIKGCSNPEVKSTFDKISLCFHNADKTSSYYGTISYSYKQKDGKIVKGKIEYAFDNLTGFEIIKNNILANLPKSTDSIKIEEFASKARKTNTITSETYNSRDEIENLLTKARDINNVFAATPTTETRESGETEAEATKTTERVETVEKTEETGKRKKKGFIAPPREKFSRKAVKTTDEVAEDPVSESDDDFELEEIVEEEPTTSTTPTTTTTPSTKKVIWASVSFYSLVNTCSDVIERSKGAGKE